MISKVFSLVNRHWKTLVLAFLVSGIIGALLTLLAGMFLLAEIDWMGVAKQLFNGEFMPVIQGVGTFVLASMLWSVYFSVSLIKVVMNIIDGKKSLDDITSAFTQPVMVYIWAFIMQLVVFGIIGAVGFLLIKYLGVGGSILWIPVAMFLYIKFFSINFVLVEDQCNGFTALGRSWKISNGHILGSLVIIIVFGIIVYLPYMIMNIVPVIGTLAGYIWLWLYGNQLMNVASLHIYRRMKGYETNNTLE